MQALESGTDKTHDVDDFSPAVVEVEGGEGFVEVGCKGAFLCALEDEEKFGVGGRGLRREGDAEEADAAWEGRGDGLEGCEKLRVLVKGWWYGGGQTSLSCFL